MNDALPPLTVEAVRRAYAGKAAVDGASLALARGRITCLLGPSGGGKTTLLRLIAGLERVDGGAIASGGKVLSGPGVHIAPERRDIGFVFQDYALFPHLSVEQNIAFGLSKTPVAARRERVADLLEQIRLPHRAKAYPDALSGGERQRVALARALARRPGVILLDEPFSGLDGPLKAEVRGAALNALRAAGAATLIVTHDAEEAMMMADDLALMDAGRILQTGTPRECYLRPVSPAAAGLLGEANFLPATAEGGRLATAFGAIAGAGRQVMARPEALRLGARGEPATVIAAAYAGANVLLTLEANGQRALSRVSSPDAPTVGEVVKVTLDPAFCAVF